MYFKLIFPEYGLNFVFQKRLYFRKMLFLYKRKLILLKLKTNKYKQYKINNYPKLDVLNKLKQFTKYKCPSITKKEIRFI